MNPEDLSIHAAQKEESVSQSVPGNDTSQPEVARTTGVTNLLDTYPFLLCPVLIRVSSKYSKETPERDLRMVLEEGPTVADSKELDGFAAYDHTKKVLLVNNTKLDILHPKLREAIIVHEVVHYIENVLGGNRPDSDSKSYLADEDEQDALRAEIEYLRDAALSKEESVKLILGSLPEKDVKKGMQIFDSVWSSERTAASRWDYWIGVVQHDESVQAHNCTGLMELMGTTHYSLGMTQGAKWRFGTAHGCVEWWDEPTPDQKFAVENFLSKKGVTVVGHRHLPSSSKVMACVIGGLDVPLSNKYEADQDLSLISGTFANLMAPQLEHIGALDRDVLLALFITTVRAAGHSISEINQKKMLAKANQLDKVGLMKFITNLVLKGMGVGSYDSERTERMQPENRKGQTEFQAWFITDFGESYTLKGTEGTKDFVLPRYAVWGDLGRGNPEVKETSDDLELLRSKYGQYLRVVNISQSQELRKGAFDPEDEASTEDDADFELFHNWLADAGTTLQITLEDPDQEQEELVSQQRTVLQQLIQRALESRPKRMGAQRFAELWESIQKRLVADDVLLPAAIVQVTQVSLKEHFESSRPSSSLESDELVQLSETEPSSGELRNWQRAKDQLLDDFNAGKITKQQLQNKMREFSAQLVRQKRFVTYKELIQLGKSKPK